MFIYTENYPEAQKRPPSSTRIAPTTIENLNGSLSGSRRGGWFEDPLRDIDIPNLDWGLVISSVIEYGRLHHQLFPEWVEADDI